MEWILGGGVLSALVLLYYTAKRNGRLEEQNKAQALQINAQAKDMANIQEDFFELQDKVNRWQSWRDQFEAKLKSVDVALLPDPVRKLVRQDPTILLEITDPYSTKMGESSRSIGVQKPKK
jgi:hypothetical protein